MLKNQVKQAIFTPQLTENKKSHPSFNNNLFRNFVSINNYGQSFFPDIIAAYLYILLPDKQ
jgi:hypothetical protein